VNKSVKNTKSRKKEIPQIALLNPEKVEKTKRYNRKHQVMDREKNKRIRA